MREPIRNKIVAIDSRANADAGLAARIAHTLIRLLRPLLDAVVEDVTRAVISSLAPKIEQQHQIQPRWLSIESAGAYIDKTYQGMRYTLREFPREIPMVMVGDKPRIDIKDIDRFMLNRKGK